MRWEGGKGRRIMKWEGGKCGSVEGGRWEGPGSILEWGTLGESKILPFCF